MNFNNMIIVPGNLFIEREVFLCNCQSGIKKHNFFNLYNHYLFGGWMHSFFRNIYLFISFEMQNSDLSFFFFFFLNTDFKNEHSRSAELGESRDFDDEDQSIFSLQTEPSHNMKSLVRVSLENVFEICLVSPENKYMLHV